MVLERSLPLNIPLIFSKIDKPESIYLTLAIDKCDSSLISQLFENIETASEEQIYSALEKCDQKFIPDLFHHIQNPSANQIEFALNQCHSDLIPELFGLIEKALEENKVDEDADETSTYRQNINP